MQKSKIMAVIDTLKFVGGIHRHLAKGDQLTNQRSSPIPVNAKVCLSDKV